MQCIIHHEGAYNIYSSISDGPVFDTAITIEELTKWIAAERGRQGVANLPARLERAHETGSSAIPYDLVDTVFANRAGPDETELSLVDFVERFLTLKK